MPINSRFPVSPLKLLMLNVGFLNLSGNLHTNRIRYIKIRDVHDNLIYQHF